ncbi:hypothetical protein HDU93_000978 [Gonapodya sp. JEL0774]|nr:hypothetical protein HDU93_000978 [Gonapodya sp. JEL0774]
MGALGDPTDDGTLYEMSIMRMIIDQLSRAGISSVLSQHRANSRPVSSYILQAVLTQTRTILTVSEIPDLTSAELMVGWERYLRDLDSHIAFVHVEGRNVEATTSIVNVVASQRDLHAGLCLSAEFEKPDRLALEQWLPALDIVFLSSLWVDARSLEIGLVEVDAAQKSKIYVEALARSGRCREGALVITTHGSSGASWARASGGLLTSPRTYRPQKARVVVDTTGAGDTFIGCVLFGISLLLGKTQLTSRKLKFLDLKDEELGSVIKFAVEVATLKCGRKGLIGLGSHQDIDEIREYLR